MAGEGDKVVFKRMAERLRASIPDSVLRVVEGAGHMVHHSAPRRVVEAVRQAAGTEPGAFRERALPLRAVPEAEGVA
jgi:pimeloyl-ACP methyl ester carboxylesterase